MAKVEISVNCRKINLVLNSDKEAIQINDTTLTQEQASALAGMLRNGPATMLTLIIKD